jgi:hypothetical protein
MVLVGLEVVGSCFGFLQQHPDLSSHWAFPSQNTSVVLPSTSLPSLLGYFSLGGFRVDSYTYSHAILFQAWPTINK